MPKGKPNKRYTLNLKSKQ